MSVEAAIREHWQAYQPLTELVPMDHLVTGWMPSPDALDDVEFPSPLPFVSLVRQGTPQTVTTSSRTKLDTVLEILNIWAASLETAKQIADALRDRFHRAAFDWSKGKVLCITESDRREAVEADGAWNITLVYLVRTSETGA